MCFSMLAAAAAAPGGVTRAALALHTPASLLPPQMRFFIKDDGREAHSNWDESEQAERVMSMSALRTDVEGGRGAAATTSNGKYGRLMAKMQK